MRERIVVLLLTGLAGCSSPDKQQCFWSESKGRASAILSEAADERTAPEAPPKAVGPVIRLDCLVAEAREADAPRLRLAVDGPYKAVSPEAREGILEGIQTNAVATLQGGPPVRVAPGQRIYVDFSLPSGAVQDSFVVRDRAKADALARETYEGLVLDAEFTLADGGDIVYRRLAPRVAFLLGVRECEAVVWSQDAKVKVRWQEDVLFVCRPRFPALCEIRVKPGETLVVPLEFTVEGTTGLDRARAIDGRVTERYSPQLSWPEGSPGDRRWVFLLRAEEVDAADPGKLD